jgi:hypothetical protein
MVETLEKKEAKHVVSVTEDEEEVVEARKEARTVVESLRKVPNERRETARGLELLIQSVILQSYDEPEESLDVLDVRFPSSLSTSVDFRPSSPAFLSPSPNALANHLPSLFALIVAGAQGLRRKDVCILCCVLQAAFDRRRGRRRRGP